MHKVMTVTDNSHHSVNENVDLITAVCSPRVHLQITTDQWIFSGVYQPEPNFQGRLHWQAIPKSQNKLQVQFVYDPYIILYKYHNTIIKHKSAIKKNVLHLILHSLVQSFYSCLLSHVY